VFRVRGSEVPAQVAFSYTRRVGSVRGSEVLARVASYYCTRRVDRRQA
jgi:hypothetical protein